jgi:hypothetical protein
MQDYNNEQWYLDLQKSLEGFTEDYLNQVSDGKIRQLEGAKNGGNVSGPLTQFSKTGIHNEEFRKQWATLGGEASIQKLLQWQIDNNFRVCDLERTDEWCNNISIALTGRKIPKSIVNKIKKTLKSKIDSMSAEERSEKYGNDATSRKSLRIRTEVLNLIENKKFTTKEAREACEKYGLKNWKFFLRDKRIIKQIHKGKNQFDPSIYEKINFVCSYN